MQATLTAEQRSLEQVATGLAADGLEHARRATVAGEAPAAFTGPFTARLNASMGGLGVPVDQGGAGGGLVDLALVLRALGRTIAPTPWLTHVMAQQVALGAGIGLGDLGEATLTLAVDEASTPAWGPWASSISNGRVAGRKVAVPFGVEASAAVVVGADDAVAVASPMHAYALRSVDATRPTADLEFQGDAAGSGTGAAAALRRACALLAAELCGVGLGAVEQAAQYARTREQFGSPIGRFQGVAHPLADSVVQLESAWSLTMYACWALDADHADAAWAVHDAKAKAGEAAVAAAERALQVHGGIGMTWEAPPHLHLRRALAGNVWLGAPRWHREHVGRLVLARCPTP